VITPEIVKLADKLPDIEMRLVVARAKGAKARADEIKRHEDAMKKLLEEDGALAAELAAAARAKKQITDAISLDLYRAAELAGSAYRKAAQEIKYERDELAAAKELLEKKDIPKDQVEALVEQAENAQAAFDRASENLAKLKAEAEKAQAAVDAAYQKIRREALAAKAERASRG
jgi:hypothetical protein